MATDVNMNEVLISPLATMVREIGASVADAQRALDAAAIDNQARLAAEHPELQALGYQVTWYQIRGQRGNEDGAALREDAAGRPGACTWRPSTPSTATCWASPPKAAAR